MTAATFVSLLLKHSKNADGLGRAIDQGTKMSLSQETDSSKEDGAEEGGQFLSKAFAIVLIFLALEFLPLISCVVLALPTLTVGSILSIKIGVNILPALGYLLVALGVALFILNIRLALGRRSLISFIGGAVIAAGLTVGGEVWTFGVAPPKTSPFPFVLPSNPFWYLPLEIETYDLIFGIALYFRDLWRALKKRFRTFFRRSS